MGHPAGSRGERGFTFIEVTFAMILLVVSAVVLISHISVNYKTTATERNRVFAYSKAQAILAEIQNFVDRGNIAAPVELDVLDDGIVSKFPLTIQTSGGTLVTADHPLSGNYQRDGQWVWSRRITVQPFAGIDNRNVRYVTVRVFMRDVDGNENAMADLSAVISSAGNSYPTAQVFDIYLLAIENIPGWWIFMDSLKPFVESMITDLENRNPGLIFRRHWITKAAFGRNPGYRPYINDANDSYAVVNDVYHYPGRMPDDHGAAYLYVPDNIKGRINVDGTDRHGYDSDLNPHPYALADFFNHAMRYPDELALWQARVDEIEERERDIADAIANGMTPPDPLDDMSKEPTLRILLEELNSQPDKYRNALMMNLHGELQPMPALRNFSDAARDPVNHPEWRVVTHPEELRTRNGDGGATDSLRFRVYAYTQNRGLYTGPDRMTEPMVVEVVGVDLTRSGSPDELDSDVQLMNLPGGVMVGASSDYATSWQPAKHRNDAPLDDEMCYAAEYVPPAGSEPGFTRIYLFNTPLIAPQDVNGRGLAATTRARLYGMEYVPTPIDAGPAFTTDLSSVGAMPKNTARWVLELTPDVLTSNMFVDGSDGRYNPAGDVVLQVRTRIASNSNSGSTDWETSGRMWPTPNQTDNLSTTYAWWTDSREDVPFTERAQFNGDPRHVPYKDCFNGGDDFPNSYNWYHDSLNNDGEPAVADFPSIEAVRLANRWQSALGCDAPRYFQLLREGLVSSACVFTTMTGWSYYYLGVGNDFGPTPSDLTPHYGVGPGEINTITGARNYVLSRQSTEYWCGFPWLGELFPDELASMWYDTTAGTLPPRGNLQAGSGTGYAFQYPCNAAYANSNRLAYGTAILDSNQRTSSRGCSAFFNIGTATTSFRHIATTGDGTLTATGQEIADNFNMKMPPTTPITRPFKLDFAAHGGEHWNRTPYATRFTGQIIDTYLTLGSNTGSGLVKLINPAGTSAAYIVVNGIDKAVATGSTFIAKWSLLALVHSFFEAGNTANTLRIPMPARVEIESPTDITELDNPASIDVLFGIEWTRWDGQVYAQTGTFIESESPLRYVLTYSPDNGVTWRHMADDSEAEVGVMSSNSAHVVADAGAGSETYTWSVPAAQFPRGSYLVRVECYRQGAQVHYSWHQTRIFIRR